MKVREIIQPQYLNEGFMDDIFSSGLTTAIKNQLAPAGGKVDKTTKIFGRLRSGSISVIKALGPLGIPIWNYNQNMLVYNDQLAAKTISQDQYIQRHEHEYGTMLAQIGSGLTVSLVGEAGIKLLSYLAHVLPIIGPMFGALVRFLAPELMVALLILINTDTGRAMLAKLISGPTLEYIGSEGLLVTYKDFKALVAKVVKMSKEEIAELTGQPKPEETPADPTKPDPTKPADPNAPVQPDPTKPADPNAPVQPDPTKPAEPEVDPASYANTNVPGSRYTDTTRFKRNANGDLILK
jgi:hypothetical protein